MDLFITKPFSPTADVDAGEPVGASLQDEVRLKRVLTARHLVLLGVGAVIGAGIFVLTGQAAANHAGPAITFSFVLAGIAAVLAALCYAEFAAMLPSAGSAYSYSYATLGEFIAWFIGWNLVLEYLLAAASVAVGWSGYFDSLLHSLGNVLGVELALVPRRIYRGTSNAITDGQSRHRHGRELGYRPGRCDPLRAPRRQGAHVSRPCRCGSVCSALGNGI